MSDNSCINVSMSYKTAIAALILVISALLGGNAGLSFLMNPAEATSDQLSGQINDIITSVDDVRKEQFVSQSNINSMKEVVDSQRLDITKLQDLIRLNAEQLNKLIGRVDMLITQGRVQ